MKKNLKTMISYYSKYKLVFWLDLFFAALSAAIVLIIPLIVRYVTSNLIYESPEFIISRGKWIALGLIFMIIVDFGCKFYISNIGHVMGTRIEYDMRAEIFDHLQKLSFSFYDNQKVGALMSRITNDLFDITELMHHGPENIILSVIKIVGAIAILVSINWKLAICAIVVLPFMFIFSYILNKKMRGAFKNNRAKIAEINGQIEDNLSGIRVVKSFANEALEEEKFSQSNQRFLEYKSLSYRYMAEFGTANRVFDGLMYIIIVVAGALLIRKGSLGVGDFTAYLLYANMLLTSIRRIVDYIEQFQRGMTGIERFFEVMDAPSDIVDRPDAKRLTNVRGEVSFDNVGFHYQDDQAQVLHHLNLRVKPGQSVALVGPSGSGKTTLCSLIPRFYDVTEGRILIDGQDIRDLTQKSLREAIGTVQQDVYLFSGTVLENILYGKPGASREDAVEAARLAGAHDFIMALPHGYDTYCGERGVRLSGGQKQRISIARVFLKNPPILILDEATSALDNESEHIVQQSLEKLAKGRTVFTIAHRLTTIRGADVIWVLTDKGIEEMGTHAELISKGGIYASLYRMYTEDR